MTITEIKREISKYCIEPMVDDDVCNDEGLNNIDDYQDIDDDNVQIDDAEYIDFRLFRFICYYLFSFVLLTFTQILLIYSDELKCDFDPYFQFECPNNPNLEIINSEEHFSFDKNPYTQNKSAKNKRVSFTKTGDYQGKKKKKSNAKVMVTKYQPTNLVTSKDFIKRRKKIKNNEESKIDEIEFKFDEAYQYEANKFKIISDKSAKTYDYKQMILFYNVNVIL